jgi:hypothetical protein
VNLRELAKQEIRCHANCATNLNKFYDFQASLPAFVFRHERLMSMKTRGQILLGQIGVVASGGQQT